MMKDRQYRHLAGVDDEVRSVREAAHHGPPRAVADIRELEWCAFNLRQRCTDQTGKFQAESRAPPFVPLHCLRKLCGRLGFDDQ